MSSPQRFRVLTGWTCAARLSLVIPTLRCPARVLPHGSPTPRPLRLPNLPRSSGRPQVAQCLCCAFSSSHSRRFSAPSLSPIPEAHPDFDTTFPGSEQVRSSGPLGTLSCLCLAPKGPPRFLACPSHATSLTGASWDSPLVAPCLLLHIGPGLHPSPQGRCPARTKVRSWLPASAEEEPAFWLVTPPFSHGALKHRFVRRGPLHLPPLWALLPSTLGGCSWPSSLQNAQPRNTAPVSCCLWVS